jgi:hypothetical protein
MDTAGIVNDTGREHNYEERPISYDDALSLSGKKV